ncbi:ABC transporter ATP-binding protein [Actinosynnema mirum]|uniref:ABC transporter related n=1 Tax=Actinosynnema mirum (strain ATCC 29888 / DSM 43827 / JCM 3225 / NBRC 14064 / NCIMB 13271 / NRRL B-12336 / IMRU 3971 / 101) TaxID=446462 RepID=C6WRV3_ACTMD|nr:ABC transporter ATP-binding protein [Actinosynnema mirum]ACU36945.1 ABC transporter related [Actinosynnema mirum DSM 43827]
MTTAETTPAKTTTTTTTEPTERTTEPVTHPALPVATGRQSAAELWRAVRAHRSEALVVLLLTLLASAGVVAGPLLLGSLVDVVREGATTGELLALLAVTAAAVLFGAVFTALALRAMERLGARISADLRERVLARALAVEPKVLERVGVGDVASRVTEDVEHFVAAVPLVSSVFGAVVTVVVSALGFASLDYRLALAFCAVFPVYALALRSYLPKAGPLYAAERRDAAERGRVLLESLHGLPTVRAYDMQELQAKRVEVASERNVSTALRALKTVLRFSVSMNAAEAVGLSALLLTGYLLVTSGEVTVGAVTAAALLFHRLFGPLGMLLMSFDDMQRAGSALARVVGVLLTPQEPERAPRSPRGPVSLTAQGVRHSYDTGREVLHGVDLEVPAGTSLAVVGASGAGKTTLAAILGGVFPATQGQVRLVDDGGPVPVGELDQDGLRDWVGVVSQETHVFAGPLRDDVLFSAPGSTDEQVRDALAAVGADAWVRALPQGLDTRVGAGEHPLTASQVQQLALARLVLRDPPVVVLDEATAEAGSSGARDLERAAEAAVRGRTAIVVAHRLTQAKACDRIAVVDAGRVVELGTHDELVALGGRYATLWAAWSQR